MLAPALGDTVLINIERRRPAPQPLFAFLAIFILRLVGHYVGSTPFQL